MSRHQGQKEDHEARRQAECDKYAMLAADADAAPIVPKKTPRVYRKGESIEGTAKVGVLKGKDLERLQKQLAGRTFGN